MSMSLKNDVNAPDVFYDPLVSYGVGISTSLPAKYITVQPTGCPSAFPTPCAGGVITPTPCAGALISESLAAHGCCNVNMTGCKTGPMPCPPDFPTPCANGIITPTPCAGALISESIAVNGCCKVNTAGCSTVPPPGSDKCGSTNPASWDYSTCNECGPRYGMTWNSITGRCESPSKPKPTVNYTPYLLAGAVAMVGVVGMIVFMNRKQEQ